MTDTALAGADIAAVRVARPEARVPRRSFRAAAKRDWRRSFATSESACRRCSRKTQTTSAPASRLAKCGASKATRRHGAWLLTRTQQITELSKHLLSKQPFKV